MIKKDETHFKRIEQKYILSEQDYIKLMNLVQDKLEKDAYFKSVIYNLYLDNERDDLIINSLEKPIYKEKVRLRSYGIPKKNDNVFLELKKKYKGIVYKRRIELKLKDFYKYLESGKMPVDNQIMREIDYVIKKKNLKPKIFIAYNRTSYFDKNDSNFRITFDEDLRSRSEDLKLEIGDAGRLYDKNKFYIMELKSPTAIPLWFTSILSELQIYPTSFSKYGNIYKKQGGNL